MPLALQTLAPTALQRAVLSTKLSLITVEATLDLSTHSGVRRIAGWVLPGLPDAGEVVPFCSAAGGVSFQINGLVDRAALVAQQDVLDALQRCVLSGGRDLARGNSLLLQHGDHRVGEAVVGLDRGVDLGVRRELLLEDELALAVVPTRSDLVADEREAV